MDVEVRVLSWAPVIEQNLIKIVRGSMGRLIPFSVYSYLFTHADRFLSGMQASSMAPLIKSILEKRPRIWSLAYIMAVGSTLLCLDQKDPV